MAKILTTAIVADIRNKLNGSVFSKNRYGSYVRTKVTPVNPQTAFQVGIRSVLTSQSQAWRGLTDAQRQSWIDAAVNFPVTDIFGNIKHLSGSALFVKLNTVLYNAGFATLTVAPSPVALAAISAGILTAAAGTPAISLTFLGGPVPTGFAVQVYATPLIAPGRSFVKNQFRYIDLIEAAGTSPYDALTAWTDRFGSLVAGQKIFFRIAPISTTTGQVGIASEVSTIVAA